MAVDRLKEILECFYEKHQEQIAWAVVATVGAIFSAGLEFGYWRWRIVEPTLADVQDNTVQLERLRSDVAAVQRGLSKVEGKLGL